MLEEWVVKYEKSYKLVGYIKDDGKVKKWSQMKCQSEDGTEMACTQIYGSDGYAARLISLKNTLSESIVEPVLEAVNLD